MSDDIIPDDKFVPDNADAAQAASVSPQAVNKVPGASSQDPGFISDEKFIPDSDKFGTGTEMLKTFAEGASRGIAGPLATGFENAWFNNAQQQRVRAETNPGTAAAGEITGLVGGALVSPEASLAGGLEKVGVAGAEALGLGAESAAMKALTASKAAGLSAAETAAAKSAALGGYGLAQKIGSGVVKGAIENLVFQGQDEVSKMIWKDPNQTADTALLSMGLAGALGGAFGAISPVWNATMAKKTEGMLGAIMDKFGGTESGVLSPAQEALSKSGLELAPEVKALASDNPSVQQAARTLNQTDTSMAGKQFQKTVADTMQQAGDKISEALGYTPEAMRSIPEISENAWANKIGDALMKDREVNMSPLASGYDELANKINDIKFVPDTAGDPILNIAAQNGTMSDISHKLNKLSIDMGWATSPSSEGAKVIKQVQKELPLQQNLGDLRQFITQIGEKISADPQNGNLYRAVGAINSVLRDAEGDLMASHIGATEGPAAVEHLRALQEGYRVESAKKDFLASRIGWKGSTAGYNQTIKEALRDDPERFLRRMAGEKDSELLGFLQSHYPEAAKAVKDYHIAGLFEKSVNKAELNPSVKASTFFRKYNGMSPELKNFLVNPESQQRLSSLETALNVLKDPNYNYSNTARTISNQMKDKWPVLLAFATSMAGGHGIGASVGLGAGANAVLKEAPDAIRLGILKFLGSDTAISAPGFKAMVEYMGHAMRGETLLSNAAKNIFKAGIKVLPDHLVPTDADRNKVKKYSMQMQKNPQDMMNITKNMGSYMPDHVGAISTAASTALNSALTAKPTAVKSAPLDTRQPASVSQNAQYNRQLDLIQQPLMIFKHIQEGTITPGDVALIKSTYPNFYNRSINKLFDNMTNAVAKGQTIPYKMRLGLSLYSGTTLDSTMSPSSIMAAQPMPAQSQPQTAMQPASNPKRSTSKLSKMPNLYQTQGQSAEKDRANRE